MDVCFIPSSLLGSCPKFLAHRMQHWHGKRAATLYDIIYEDESFKTIGSLAKNLHYSDIVALSLTCSAFHRIIFPKSRSLNYMELIKVAACDSARSECWCCSAEICKV